MKIMILNGNPDSQNRAFDEYLKNLSEGLGASRHSAATLQLRGMNIGFCAGCFGCWVKTPGRCKVRDDSDKVCNEYIHSDLVIFASPLKMGLVTCLLKKANDKLISLLSPYIVFVQGESHHGPRYGKYPGIGLLLEKEADSDEEDIRIVSAIYSRDALNLQTKLHFTKLVSDPLEDVINEINNI
jgi:multimeric flavodoxin WrbA